MNQPKTVSSATGVKSKKQIKMKGKNSQTVSTTTAPSVPLESSSSEKEKGSPIKDFAGISSDSIRLYAEQTNYEHLSEEVCNILTEDINYKLRYIIHNSLIKAKLQGREVIVSEDLDETFSNLQIDKVYGAPSNPNWLQSNDNILFLDDQKINLIEISEEEIQYNQEGDILLDQVWLLNDDDSDGETEKSMEVFTEYFEAMCQAIISNDEQIRNMALKDISENASIGPITDWFYHFSYFLLMRDITYDCLTMRGLQLLEILENSPLPSLHIHSKQLKLLVRLLLQRLLISVTTEEVLKPMCYVLSLLCLKDSLRKMVLSKVEDKFMSVFQEMPVPLLNIIYFLGIEAVEKICIPNINYILSKVVQENRQNLNEIILAIYGLICKAEMNVGLTYFYFSEVFGLFLVPYWRQKKLKFDPVKPMEIDFVNMKKQLIRTRRKVDFRIKNSSSKKKLEEVFEIPVHDCPVRKNLDNQKYLLANVNKRKETRVTVGKTSLLLSVLKCKKGYNKCYDHSLLAHNL